MRLLQRYIFAELIRVFSLLVVILTIMLVFVGLFREATDRGLGAVQILQIMPFVVPSLLPFTIPATLLLAVCVVYGRLSGDLEVTAAKSAGISAIQLLSPAFLLAGVLSAVAFGLTNYAIPWAVTNIERIVTQAVEDIFLDILDSQRHYSDAAKGYSITVHDVQGKTLQQATFLRRDSSGRQVFVRAREAAVEFDLEAKVIQLHLKQARGGLAGADTEGELEETTLEFPLPQEIAKVKARHMTLTDLEVGGKRSQLEYERLQKQLAVETAMALTTGQFDSLANGRAKELSASLQQSIRTGRRLHTEIHSRISMAASCLFFVFVGGPFSILQARRQFLTTFVMCFLPILLIYYPAIFLMMNLSRAGTVDPVWAMWIPNLLLVGLGAGLLRTVTQH
ncbi:MAG: LptF/LptG family permease [Planctomycetaceae bacterium]